MKTHKKKKGRRKLGGRFCPRAPDGSLKGSTQNIRKCSPEGLAAKDGIAIALTLDPEAK